MRIRHALLAFLMSFFAAIVPGTFAQKIGQPLWVGDVALSTNPGEQGFGSADGRGLAVISDNAGGAIIVWEDAWRNQIYAQRANASGVPLWSDGGIVVAPESGYQMSPRAVSDCAGGVNHRLDRWPAERNGAVSNFVPTANSLCSGSTPADSAFGATVAFLSATLTTESPKLPFSPTATVVVSFCGSLFPATAIAVPSSRSM